MLSFGPAFVLDIERGILLNRTMNTSEIDRTLFRAGESLEAAVTLVERGFDAAARDYAKHAFNAATVVLPHVTSDTDKFLAENIRKEAENLLLPAYMRKAGA